jgi:ADP-heptose:LPS heptosyltransferase
VEKKKLLLVGYRAFGDWIYSCPVLPYLFEKYDVYGEMNFKGEELFHDDLRFKAKAYFYFESIPKEEYAQKAQERLDRVRDQVKPDVEINLNGSLEAACIARREQPEFNAPIGDRRVIFGSNGFYDSVFKRCGMETPNPINLEGLYYPPEIIKWAEDWREKNSDKFIIIMPVNGSSVHKRFRNWKEVATKILDTYQDSVIYLAGDNADVVKGFSHPRVRYLFWPSLPIKQTFLMTKYADMVIGPETGVMAAAGMWGTPKIMMTSASSVWQVAQYSRNDFSFQLPVACSPCPLSVYQIDDCENVIDADQERIPACVREFPVGMIMDRVDYVYRKLRKRILVNA